MAISLLPILVAALFGAPNEGTSRNLSKSAVSDRVPTQDADVACAKCHASIYNSYRQMAHTSGSAIDNFILSDFAHARSGVHYRIYSDAGRAWLSFDRDSENPLHGKRELLYYIGSGRRGLTYLFADDGFFFESPINWYGDKCVWDMTPSYEQIREAPLNLPVHTGCLHCHVSGMKPPLDGTENRLCGAAFDAFGRQL